MGLCLVTKLKESVADTSLSKIGEKTFILLAGQSVTLSGTGLKIRGIDGNFDVTGKVTNVNSYELPGGYNFIKNPNSHDLLLGVSELDKLISISVESPYPKSILIDLSFFKEAVALNDVGLSKQTFIGGTLADFSACRNIRFLDVTSSAIVGSIVDIAGLSWAEGQVPFVFGCPNVSGDIIDFVKARRQAGRTSDNISHTYWAIDSGVTFNGNPIVGDETILSWTANTITFNGETINA